MDHLLRWKMYLLIVCSIFLLGCEGEEINPRLTRMWICPNERVNASIAWDDVNLWNGGATDYYGEQKYFCFNTEAQTLSSSSAPGAAAGNIEWDGRHLWVDDQTRIYRVTREGVVVDTLPPGTPIGQMVCDGNHMWVCAGFDWYELTTDGNVIGKYSSPWGSLGSAWDGKAFWTFDTYSSGIIRTASKITDF